jgi:hypothetical protein
LRWNIAAAVRWWHLVATLLLFLFIGWQSAAQVVAAAQTDTSSATISVWDGLFVGFAGPTLMDASLLNLLRWFVPQLLFFYIIGDLAHGELTQQGHALVPAIGSRHQWWWGKILLLGLLSALYITIGVSAALIGASTLLPWSPTWAGGVFALAGWMPKQAFPTSGTVLVTWILVLYICTLFALAVCQTTLALLFRRSFYGLVATLGVLLGSWLLGTNQPALVRWLPGSHSMLQRHSLWDAQVPLFSLQWSAAYTVALAAIAIGVGGWYVGHMDIFGKSLNDRH